MNNLYGWAMSEYLPDDRFKWLKSICLWKNNGKFKKKNPCEISK